ncbi:MAG: hypothetical protein UT11_C0012G0009 [Berkelbacteria bacterium GW2011_GWA2_38_9]|uniref:Uncharacterized protein n=1 Tax=Berkelbacteria bacterium GW2011_GWA2_38_9 TaxID=1618334 RepID=A0A0G0PLH5_9BACT|nr:MAG: hypothetical protein UT11_C0012G0009 [Berkelbacteria bacterium GW2011_GWA2_38_9]
MANKKQQNNAANRQKDAAKRGREPRTRERERQVGITEEHSRKAKGSSKK